jgi:hypothetical protein
MALVPYPFDSQDITEAQYGALIGLAMQSGISGGAAANNFKVTAAGTSMQLTVTSVGAASFAVVRGHGVLMTANELVTVPAASAGARVDLVVLRLDYATNTIAPAVRQGTSGSSTPPAPVWGVSNQYEIPLAQVAVAAGATVISNANITDRRAFLGTQVGAWPTTSRPTSGPAFGWNLTTSKWEASLDGVTWADIATLSTQLSTFAGTLPVSKGGTGGTTKVAAQQGINIYAQSAAPAHEVGRIWVKLPS